MKLLIKNLGSIHNNTQSIDLSKQFYIFVGKNNSGKTHVSQLLWTIFNRKIIRKFASEVALEHLEEYNFQDNSRFQITNQFVDSLLAEYSIFLKDELLNTYNIRKSESFLLEDSVIEFKADLDHLKKIGIEIGFKVNIGDLDRQERTRVIRHLMITKEIDSLTLIINEGELDNEILTLMENNDIKIPKDLGTKELVVSTVLERLLTHHHETFFLPASRAFYTTFYQYIYDIERQKREEDIRNILDFLEGESRHNRNQVNLQTVKEKLKFQRPYTEPMNHVFEALYSLNQDGEIVDCYEPLVEKLSQIMGGSIDLKSLEGLSPIEFYFKFNETKPDLPMYLASSSANQLVLMYLYLKYWASERANFLIIDEPEENLHPENQVRLLELLVQFATQNNNKVLIATHSPLLANSINSYIYIDILKNQYKLSDGEIEKIVEDNDLKYVDTEISIPKELVGVYFFDGSKIVDYESEDYGVYFRDFRSVTQAVELTQKTFTDYIYLKEMEDE